MFKKLIYIYYLYYKNKIMHSLACYQYEHPSIIIYFYFSYVLLYYEDMMVFLKLYIHNK